MGLQVLGALSLVTASRRPAASILKAAGFRPSAPEPDWHQLIVSTLKREPTLRRAESGPDHDRIFTITVEANGLTASATGRSVRAARAAAFRVFVQRNLPQALAAQPVATAVRRPRPYDARMPAHDRASVWARQAFEINDAALVSQALTHASWVHENRPLVTRAHQRDLSVLATEGSEVLTTLVRHQRALHTLNASFEPSPGAITSPAVTRDALAGLLDLLPLGGGVLRSKGLPALTADMKENVMQAVAAAAWRANGDRIFHRQEESFARWVHAFSPPADPVTQLQTYCSRAKAKFDVTFQERGAQHEREFKACITFQVPTEPSWVGAWSPSRMAAKQDAARGVLNLLLDERSDAVPVPAVAEGRRIVSGFFTAELDSLESQEIGFQRAIAGSHLGADLLIAGSYEQFLTWASRRSALLGNDQAELADRLARFLESVLVNRRRDAVRTWIVRNEPSRTSESADPAQRIKDWLAGDGPGRLALLNDVLEVVARADLSEAILDCVELQGKVVAAAAGETLETSRTESDSGRTITIRLRGAEFSKAFAPVIGAIDAVIGFATWSRRTQALSMTIPGIPRAVDPLSRAGLDAVTQALRDPWLTHCRAALNDFLALTEHVSDVEKNEANDVVQAFMTAELRLLDALRVEASLQESS